MFPADRVGLLAVESVMKGATQKNLSSFHMSGSSQEISSELPIQNVINLTAPADKMLIACRIEDEAKFKKNCIYRQISYYIRGYRTSKFEEDKYWMRGSDTTIRLYIDYVKLLGDCRCLEDLSEVIKNTIECGNVITSCDFVGIIDISIDEKLLSLNKKIWEIYEIPMGVEGIFGYENGKVSGTNLEFMLNGSYADSRSIKSNNIKQVYRCLGIEACRAVIRDEISRGGGKLMADFMTFSGRPEAFSKNHSSFKEDKGFLVPMSFEKPMEDLRKLGTGRTESGGTVYSQIMMGTKPTIGTNDTLFEIIDENN